MGGGKYYLCGGGGGNFYLGWKFRMSPTSWSEALVREQQNLYKCGDCVTNETKISAKLTHVREVVCTYLSICVQW